MNHAAFVKKTISKHMAYILFTLVANITSKINISTLLVWIWMVFQESNFHFLWPRAFYTHKRRDLVFLVDTLLTSNIVSFFWLKVPLFILFVFACLFLARCEAKSLKSPMPLLEWTFVLYCSHPKLESSMKYIHYVFQKVRREIP